MDCRRAEPDGAQGGEGCPAEKARVASNNLRVACLSLVGFIPAGTRSRSIWGLGVVMGEGARASVFPRTFRKPPVRRGKGARQGAWVSTGCFKWGLGSPGQARPHCWPTGSELESGSNRLFKLPRVCAGGGERAELGVISHASPPRRPGSLPTRLPRASRPGGAPGVEGALSAPLGRRGRKLANEGQKRWGRRNYFF